MAEEGNAGASTGTETPPAPLVDDKGVLREGWQEILPEDLREEPYLKEVKNLEGISRSVVSARKMVGANKMTIPTEASSEEEWDNYHKIGGRPDTAADYNYVRPEALPEEHWNQDFANAAQEILFKGGASKKLADALLELNVQTTIATLKAKVEAEQTAYKEAEIAWHKECGNAIEQKTHLGNIAIDQGVRKTERVGTESHEVVDEEFRARLTEKFGNDIDFVKFTSNLGSKFAEHGDIAAPGVPTPGDIQTQIDNEMASKAYGTDYTKHGFTKAQHEAQVKKVSRLFDEKAAATKTG